MIGEKQSLMKNDVLWNALGSMTYAMASMVLAFFVLRILGEKEGGIFGFGYSTLGQQFFILAYFGIRPFHITDMRGEFSFRDYHYFRILSSFFAVLLSIFFLLYQYTNGSYTVEKVSILFFLCLYKILDGYIDVYESELQRRGKLYKTGQSLFFRTILSVLVLLCSLSLNKTLLLGVILMNLSQVLSLYLFAILPLEKTKELEAVNLSGENKVFMQKMKALFSGSVFLFLSVFLDFYVFSSSKYAVDAVLGSSSSGIYNLLFMPSNFIYLLANFIIRPALPTLAALWQSGDKLRFKKEESSLMKKVLLLSLLLFGLAFLLSPLALWILEKLLGPAFSGKITGERWTFCLLILGGCFYALANLEYYILVTKRQQKRIFTGYALGAVLSFFTADLMVKEAGFFFASIQFVLMMLFLFLFFLFSGSHVKIAGRKGK
jgi:polysaccharides export protein